MPLNTGLYQSAVELEQNGAITFTIEPPSIPSGGRRKASLPFKTKLVIEGHPLEGFFLPLVPYRVKRIECEHIVTVPTQDAEVGSQLWHRDLHSGASCIRAMVYLTDVTMEHGPFCYRLKNGDERIYTGPRGTVIVFDIGGLHRGLKNVSGERQVLCFTYHGR
jgi:hypothetical protein